MNIAVLCYHRIGGSGVVAFEIGRAMAEERGHNVHFVGLEPPFRLKDVKSDRLHFHKIDLKEYPVFDFQPYALALASRLSDILCEHKIDVIHSHYAMPHAVSAIMAREISDCKVRCVTTLHGTDITVVGVHPTMMNITKYAIHKSDAVTAVSDFLKNETAERFFVKPERIHRIYNFVNSRFFYPVNFDWRERKRKVFLHISNLREVKAPLDVVNIFNGIYRKTGMDCELRIIGEGPLKGDMIALAQKLGISDRVKFLGIKRELKEAFADTDVFILPSRNESFGLVALEAMAFGVPVIASAVGGLPEVIEDGENGCIFRIDKPEEAVEKGAELILNPDFYEKVRTGGLETAEKKFRMDKIIDQYEQLYRG